MKPTITLTIGKHEYILTPKDALYIAAALYDMANVATVKMSQAHVKKKRVKK